MPNANTDHSRKLRQETASARIKRLQGEGWRRLTIMLPPAAVDALERLVRRYGSKQAAIAAALEDAAKND